MKKLLFIILVSLLFTSCASFWELTNFPDNVHEQLSQDTVSMDFHNASRSYHY